MNAELIAALERAIANIATPFGGGHGDAALISAHIADLRNGGERAKVVAWRPIKTVPRDGTAVLYWDGEFVGIGSMFGDEMFGPEGPVHATHWMPTPEPPKGDEND